MEPILIGYFPKQRMAVPDWFKSATVTQIASVSECIVPGPDDWINLWQHNSLLLFDTPELAAAVVPSDSLEAFDIYEYRAFPFQVDRNVQKPWDIDINTPVPIEDDRLAVRGFDMVSRSMGHSFECSPLSCNSMADEWPTNSFCLIDDASTAIDYAHQLSVGNAEPGPYCVVRVAQVIAVD